MQECGRLGTSPIARQELEKVPCDLCGSDLPVPLFPTRDRLHLLPGRFLLVRCRHCGLVYLSPRPSRSSMARYYPRDYACFGTFRESMVFRMKRRALAGALGEGGPSSPGPAARTAFRLLGPLFGGIPWTKRAGKVLDLGCGTGWYLRLFRGLPNWEVFGLEPDGRSVDRAREEGLDVRQGILEEADFPEGSFDVVHLWHVLEHLHSPRESLSRIRSLLAPGGELILCVPNLGSLAAKIFGRRWFGLESPRHLFVFTERTLHRLLEASGFFLIRVRHFGIRSMLGSLQFLCGDFLEDVTGNREVPGEILQSPALTKALTPLDFLMGFLGAGDSLEVHAVRRPGE